MKNKRLIAALGLALAMPLALPFTGSGNVADVAPTCERYSGRATGFPISSQVTLRAYFNGNLVDTRVILITSANQAFNFAFPTPITANGTVRVVASVTYRPDTWEGSAAVTCAPGPPPPQPPPPPPPPPVVTVPPPTSEAPPAPPVTPETPTVPTPPAPPISVRQFTLVKNGPNSATVGDRIQFKIRVRNTGNTVLRNLRLVDTMPDALALANRPRGVTISNGSLIWKIASLGPGKRLERTINVVPVGGTPGGTIKVCNRAQLTVGFAANLMRRNAKSCIRITVPTITRVAVTG